MLSQGYRRKMRQVLERYPSGRSALLPALYLAQEEHGYLSQEAMAEVAEYLGLPLSEVVGVVSFYSLFFRKPVGRHVIQVCTNVSCSLLGAEHILDYLSRKLGIRVGETTRDGLFTLEEVECLGACEMAPLMYIDDTYYGLLTPEKVDEILRGLGEA